MAKLSSHPIADSLFISSNISLTDRIEGHHRSGSLAGLAESGDVHGIHSELVLQSLDQAGHLVMALQAWQLVLPYP